MTTALSLFSGAEGFGLGARMAGLDVVASIEREEMPHKTATLNGFNSIQADVTAVDFTQWRGVDVIFGGPPCQGHSIANNRNKQANDPRNELAWQMVRAARETGARHVLIENVVTFDKALLADLLRELTALGYWVSTETLNAADYGVPQTRRRRFIWATRDLMHHWPNPTHVGRWVSINTALAGLEFRPAELPRWLIEKFAGDIPVLAVIDCQNSNKSSSQGRTGDQPAMTMVSGSYYHRVRVNPDWRLIDCQNSNDFVKRQEVAGDQCAYTMTASSYYHRVTAETHTGYGMLDPHGMARFQSFPDDYKFVGNRDQQGLQIGNAVPPLLAYALLRGLSA